LSISDEVSIGFFGREPGLELPQQTRQVDDLAVCSTHCTQTVTVGEKFCEARIDGGLVVEFMFDDLPCNDRVRL
jgi:hypothetical protein